MIPYRRIGGFFLCLLAVYGLLIAAWPLVDEAYLAGYRAIGNALFESSMPHGRIRFTPLVGADDKMDTRLYLENRLNGYTQPIRISGRRMSYVATAEVVALIIATPLPWSRRWRALLYGLVLAQGLALFRLAVLILHGFGGTHEAALYTPGPTLYWIMSAACASVATGFGFAFAAPIGVWILATFRRGDLRLLTARDAPPDAAAGRGDVADDAKR